MDKQKLITIVKDQLKGGIGEAQIRELLTYRGVEEKDIDGIIQAAINEEAQAPSDTDSDIVKKTDEALTEILQKPATRPDYKKREFIIIIMATVGLVIATVVGSIVYYFYF